MYNVLRASATRAASSSSAQVYGQRVVKIVARNDVGQGARSQNCKIVGTNRLTDSNFRFKSCYTHDGATVCCDSGSSGETTSNVASIVFGVDGIP